MSIIAGQPVPTKPQATAQGILFQIPHEFFFNRTKKLGTFPA